MRPMIFLLIWKKSWEDIKRSISILKSKSVFTPILQLWRWASGPRAMKHQVTLTRPPWHSQDCVSVFRRSVVTSMPSLTVPSVAVPVLWGYKYNLAQFVMTNNIWSPRSQGIHLYPGWQESLSTVEWAPGFCFTQLVNQVDHVAVRGEMAALSGGLGSGAHEAAPASCAKWAAPSLHAGISRLG